MGVTGLWTVVQPCARPIRLETLNKKRLAVDASIWIYQFLKAVRDKEGNALRNSHVVGFFRRICKLLFFGIKPVFVFDGGAPALKRQTIAGRKRRREGRREDAVRTAGKLLALQMQRRAEEEAERRKQERHRPPPAPGAADAEEEAVPEHPVYVEEMYMTAEERQRSRRFKKKDAYHLPDLDDSMHNLGAPDDPRIMSQEELQEYARQFNSGEDINLYDFSKIDFNSPFFMSLPASDRYNILNAARLRSRLRMGYSKDQLDSMFPDRMAFSRFQIERVAERNDLTQRLMNLNGMNGEDPMYGAKGVGRVAGEKGREYVLVKNDGVEGGWALGVVTNKEEGQRSKPIDVDRLHQMQEVEEEEDDDANEDDAFEDVPIEGLNRLPKRRHVDGHEQREIGRKRRAVYESRVPEYGRETGDPDSLFVGDGGDTGKDVHVDDLFVERDRSEDDEEEEEEEEEALHRAIAMSLQDGNEKAEVKEGEDRVRIVDLKQSTPVPPTPFRGGSGISIAHVANKRSLAAAQKPSPRPDEDVDVQNAMAASRDIHAKNMSIFQPELSSSQPKTVKAKAFGGPLPFEKLDFSKSLLGAKKAKPGAGSDVARDTEDAADTVDEAGGFLKDTEEQPPPAKPLPPWFSGDVQKDAAAQQEFEERQRQVDLDTTRERERDLLRRTPHVINVDDVASDDESVDMVDVPMESRVEEPVPPVETGPRVEVVPEVQTGPEVEVGPEVEIDSAEVEWEASDEEATQKNGHMRQPVSEESDHEEVEWEEVVQEDGQERQSASTTAPPLPIDDSFDQAPVEEVEEAEDDYSDPEDDELMRQLAVEAEEHARFASELNHKSTSQNHEDYERDLRALRNQQKKDRRDADEVSQIMVTECQQLLKLFGIPYITAPMEAEAQCAELVKLGLVDGIVTDDSDIFLFGGTRVYKNMFNQAKFVECYLLSDLEKEFDLDRRKMIHIAHLLGSDYTEGIPSIGPVTAVEIVSEFPSATGLTEFKEWWARAQRNEPETTASKFRTKFRRNASRIFLPPGFPSPAVTQAYLEPEVDSSADAFKWGVPDLDSLRSFLMATIGWTQERTDEVLVPVIRDMNRREREGTQANITGFFAGGVGLGARGTESGRNGGSASTGKGKGSKRMEGALSKLREGAARKRGDGGEDRMTIDE
ncbi:MAG: DNA repair protein rad2 [Thelocarpon superellum]|nr:MAG: DNA repair protein rad2 [Thelocarpon superellum]